MLPNCASVQAPPTRLREPIVPAWQTEIGLPFLEKQGKLRNSISCAKGECKARKPGWIAFVLFTKPSSEQNTDIVKQTANFKLHKPRLVSLP
jgi:hypothetical protein